MVVSNTDTLAKSLPLCDWTENVGTFDITPVIHKYAEQPPRQQMA